MTPKLPLPKKDPITAQENCLKLTGDLWNELQSILAIDDVHPDDMNDLRHHIHAIQNILYTQLYIKKHGQL